MFKELKSLFQKGNLLQQSYNDCSDMLATDLSMFLESIRSLREAEDAVLAFDIYEKDKLINAFERETRRRVLTHLSVAGPAELPMGIKLISIVVDIERIGDYTKNIVELAQNHPTRLDADQFENALLGIELAVKESFTCMVNTFSEQDEECARQVMHRHQKEVASVSDRIMGDMIQGQIGGLEISSALTLVIYMRYLKRVSSHLKNIATSIVNPIDRIGYVE